jgi:hypothetical protein
METHTVMNLEVPNTTVCKQPNNHCHSFTHTRNTRGKEGRCPKEKGKGGAQRKGPCPKERAVPKGKGGEHTQA